MKSDIEIAQEAKMKPITEIAASLGLADEDVIPYGRYKAKINHRLIHKASKQGKMVLVTAINFMLKSSLKCKKDSFAHQ